MVLEKNNTWTFILAGGGDINCKDEEGSMCSFEQQLSISILIL